MADAKARGWGDPGPKGSAAEAKYKRDHLVWIVLNCGVRLYVRREVAPLLKGFWDELEAETGYSLADQGVPDDWGFANRPNRNNPKVKSNHAWGLAVDGNSEENPNTHDGKVHSNMPLTVMRRLAKKYGLRLGADYSGKTKDPMHVEYIGTPAEANALVAELARAQSLNTQSKKAEDDDMFLVIGYKGGPALWAFFPALGKKVTFPDEAAYVEAIAGDGYGGHLRMGSDDIKAIPYLDANKKADA